MNILNSFATTQSSKYLLPVILTVGAGFFLIAQEEASPVDESSSKKPSQRIEDLSSDLSWWDNLPGDAKKALMGKFLTYNNEAGKEADHDRAERGGEAAEGRQEQRVAEGTSLTVDEITTLSKEDLLKRLDLLKDSPAEKK